MSEFLPDPPLPDDATRTVITPDGKVLELAPGDPAPEPGPVQPASYADRLAAMQDFTGSMGFVDDAGDPVVYEEMPTGVGEHDDDD